MWLSPSLLAADGASPSFPVPIVLSLHEDHHTVRSLCVWHFSLSRIPLRFVYVVAGISSSSLSLLCIILLYRSIIICLPLPQWREFGLLPVLAITKKGAIHVPLQVLV